MKPCLHGSTFFRLLTTCAPNCSEQLKKWLNCVKTVRKCWLILPLKAGYWQCNFDPHPKFVLFKQTSNCVRGALNLRWTGCVKGALLTMVIYPTIHFMYQWSVTNCCWQGHNLLLFWMWFIIPAKITHFVQLSCFKFSLKDHSVFCELREML